MNEIVGNFIRPFPSTPIEDAQHVYGQAAEIVLALAQLTFPKIGMLSVDKSLNHVVVDCLFHDMTTCPAFSTATEYYTTRFKQFLEDKKNQMPTGDDWVVFAWLCLQSIPRFIIADLDNGLFPLHHPDLNNGNILYDEKKTVGVLD